MFYHLPACCFGFIGGSFNVSAPSFVFETLWMPTTEQQMAEKHGTSVLSILKLHFEHLTFSSNCLILSEISFSTLGLVIAVIFLVWVVAFAAVFRDVAVAVLLVVGGLVVVLGVHPPRQDVLYPVLQLLRRGQVLVVGHVQPNAVGLERNKSHAL